MNVHEKVKTESGIPLLDKIDAKSPALHAIGRDGLIVKEGTNFGTMSFRADTSVIMPPAGLVPGTDYAVILRDDVLVAVAMSSGSLEQLVTLGGFHFAPGGNATARSGGDEVPAINPCSLWDIYFRPACPDPRGMALVQKPGGQFWCDIYLTGRNCADDGTSRFGVTIADGDDRPAGFKKFDYATAATVMAYHGKGLLSFEEFAAAAIGVTEKTANRRDPETTGLDAARTSRFGLMQATGNLWVWGHDGDSDEPRASGFGGSWFDDGYAGSRFADVATHWPDYSSDDLGARGRCDHLQPV